MAALDVRWMRDSGARTLVQGLDRQREACKLDETRDDEEQRVSSSQLTGLHSALPSLLSRMHLFVLFLTTSRAASVRSRRRDSSA